MRDIKSGIFTPICARRVSFDLGMRFKGYETLVNMRSSQQRCSVRKDVLAKFIGKHLYQSLLLKKDFGTGVFL